MSRMRVLKPEFFTDSAVVRCTPLARLLFIGSWVFADDNGIITDDMLQLKMQALPGDNVDCEELKCEIVGAGLWVPYQADGHRLILIRSFSRHQTLDRPMPIHPLPDASELAGLGLGVVERTYQRHGKPTTVRILFDVRSPNVLRPFDVRSPRIERKGIEEKGIEDISCSDSRNGESTEPDASPSQYLSEPPSETETASQKAPDGACCVPDALCALPLYAADKRLCGRWDALRAAWAVAYPQVDIEGEIRKAHAWEMANRRKVNRARFLGNWLARCQDRPAAAGGWRGDVDDKAWLSVGLEKTHERK